MNVPVYGNNAYKYEQEPVRVQRRAPKRKNKNASKAFVLLAVITLLAFCLLFRSAQLLAQKNEINSLAKELEAVQSEIIQQEFEINKTIDFNTVENIATTKLGMQRADKSQIVYVDMNNEDYAEVENQGQNVFSAFIRKILE